MFLLIIVASRRFIVSVFIQTVGFFYLFDRELVKKQEQEEEKKLFEKQLRDRRLLLIVVSLGKGIGFIFGDFSRYDEIDCNVILILIFGSLSCFQLVFLNNYDFLFNQEFFLNNYYFLFNQEFFEDLKSLFQFFGI